MILLRNAVKESDNSRLNISVSTVYIFVVASMPSHSEVSTNLTLDYFIYIYIYLLTQTLRLVKFSKVIRQLVTLKLLSFYESCLKYTGMLYYIIKCFLNFNH